MHPSSFIASALVAAPVAVSAAGTLGFALGYQNGDGSCKVTSDFVADFNAIKSNSGSTLVRTYTSSSNCNVSANIIPAAKSAGFQVLLGVWPDTPDSYAADKAALQATVPGNEDVIFGITVGSECLYRYSQDPTTGLSAAQLLPMIQEVQGLFPQVTVGTADSWNKYADGTADPLIQGGVKLLLANGFSYWQSQNINNGTASYFDDMMQALGHIQKVSGSLDAVHFMTGETGWPTDGGTNYGAAIAGTQNAASYWSTGVCGMLDWGVDVFYFEAFDEPFKPAAIGTDGQAEDETHWGAFTVDRSPKFSLKC